MKTVSMFVPCTVDILLPDIGVDMYRLLSRLGVRAVYHEEQTCCGQPSINAGYLKQARDTARHFIDVFGEDDVVVTPSGSCVYTVKHHYPELLCDEPGYAHRAKELASKVYELSQYLVDVLGIVETGSSFQGKVTYHESCHILRGLGISDQPKKLINAVKGVEFIPLNNADRCCGFGGEFANNYPDISEEMVKDKVDNYLNSGADLLVLCEPGCLLNISGYLSRNRPDKKVMHLASFLSASV